MTGRRRHSLTGQLTVFVAACAVITVAGLGLWAVQHALILMVTGALAVAGAYVAGHHRGLGAARRLATRQLDDVQRERLVAELEHLAARSLDEIVSSYRVIARRHQGGTRLAAEHGRRRGR